MARQDTSVGISNFTQVFNTTSETPLLVPTSPAPGFPSPVLPLSTSTYPSGLFIGVPQDIATGVYDGHPFEVSLACKISSSGTTNCLINLYNAKASTFAGGPAASTYTLGTLGTGCTKVVTGTATSGLTSAASVNYWLSAKFVWDSVTQKLGYCLATQYQSGASVAVASSASATTVGFTDLNFIPSFTFASAATVTVLVTEFVINRL